MGSYPIEKAPQYLLLIAMLADNRHVNIRTIAARTLRTVGHVHLVSHAREFVRLLKGRAAAGVVVAESLPRLLHDELNTHTVAPLVLVATGTDPTPRSGRALANQCSDVIVPSPEVELSLAPTVLVLLVDAMLGTWREVIAGHPNLRGHPTFRSALVHAIQRRPFISVKAMARHAGCSSRTLERAWTGLSSSGKSPHLKGFLRMNALVWLLRSHLKRQHESWSSLADQIGLSRQTARAYVRAASGKTLRHLEISDIARIVHKLRQETRDWIGCESCRGSKTQAG